MDSADMWRMVVARTSNMWSCREDSRGVAHGESCGEARQGRQEGGISVAKIWQKVKEAAGGAPGGPETGPSAPWEAGQSISCQSCQCSRCCAHSGGRARPPAGGEERERKGKGRDGEGGDAGRAGGKGGVGAGDERRGRRRSVQSRTPGASCSLLQSSMRKTAGCTDTMAVVAAASAKHSLTAASLPRGMRASHLPRLQLAPVNGLEKGMAHHIRRTRGAVAAGVAGGKGKL